jgi:hypothetical protein
MKAALFTVLTLAATSGFAAQLTCQRVDKPNRGSEKIFDQLSMKIELPDVSKSAPGQLPSQKVALTFNEMGKVVTKTAKFRQRGDALVGSVLYGEDFGAGNMSLFWDYDSKEVVAVIVVSSDGPMNVDLQRCK